MYQISDHTKRNLENTIGISLEEFDNMSADEQDKYVEQKIGHPLRLPEQYQKTTKKKKHCFPQQKRIRRKM